MAKGLKEILRLSHKIAVMRIARDYFAPHGIGPATFEKVYDLAASGEAGERMWANVEPQQAAVALIVSLAASALQEIADGRLVIDGVLSMTMDPKTGTATDVNFSPSPNDPADEVDIEKLQNSLRVAEDLANEYPASKDAKEHLARTREAHDNTKFNIERKRHANAVDEAKARVAKERSDAN